MPGAYSRRMVRSHPIVQAVIQKRSHFRVFIEKRKAVGVSNLPGVVERTAKMRRLRTEAPLLAV